MTDQLPPTKGKWQPFYSNRATGHRLLGFIELFASGGQWFSVPGASRVVSASGQVK